jgi:hypothetical protein
LIAEFAAKENLKSSFPLRFKARQKGGVDIRVECVTPDGLSGKKPEPLAYSIPLSIYADLHNIHANYGVLK